MLVNFMHLLMFYWIENTNGLSVMMGSLSHKQSLSLNYLNGMGSWAEFFLSSGFNGPGQSFVP
jgi:hypothetical protein